MREGWSLLAYLPSDLVNRGRRVGGGRGRIQSNIRFTVLMRVAAVHYDVKRLGNVGTVISMLRYTIRRVCGWALHTLRLIKWFNNIREVLGSGAPRWTVTMLARVIIRYGRLLTGHPSLCISAAGRYSMLLAVLAAICYASQCGSTPGRAARGWLITVPVSTLIAAQGVTTPAALCLLTLLLLPLLRGPLLLRRRGGRGDRPLATLLLPPGLLLVLGAPMPIGAGRISLRSLALAVHVP